VTSRNIYVWYVCVHLSGIRRKLVGNSSGISRDSLGLSRDHSGTRREASGTAGS